MHTFRSVILVVGVLALLGGGQWQAIQTAATVHDPTPVVSVMPDPAMLSAVMPRAEDEVPTTASALVASAPSTAARIPETRRRTLSPQPQAQPTRRENIWSGPTTAEVFVAVEETLKDLGAKKREEIQLTSAVCEAASCQIALAAADMEAMSDFLTALPFHFGWNATAHMENITNPDGSMSTTVHLEKDDESPAEY